VRNWGRIIGFPPHDVAFVGFLCHILIRTNRIRKPVRTQERVQTKEKEAENGETLRCVSSLAEAGF
jgi:hypothetical protein